MIRLAITVVSFLLASCAHTDDVELTEISDWDNTAETGSPGQTIAFIGEMIALDKLDYEEYCPLTEDGQLRLCMDSRFNARYRIVELLDGDYDGETIDFAVYDHYGLPNFSKHARVILYVKQFETGLYHHKYAYDPLSPTREGEFAFCGDPYADYDLSQIEENGRADLTPFDFEPPIRRKISDWLYEPEDYADLSQEVIREDFVETMRKFAPPAWEINGNQATCKMGMVPEALANVRMQYEYSD